METFSIDKHYNKIKLVELRPTSHTLHGLIGYKIIEGANLSCLDKLIPKCQILLIDTLMIRSNILSILKLKDLKCLDMSNTYKETVRRGLVSSHFINAFKIVQKYVESKNIVSCAEELIEAGLKEFARL